MFVLESTFCIWRWCNVTFWCELLLLIDKIFYTCKLGMINFQTIQVYNYSALSSAGIQSHEDKCIHNLLFTCCEQNIICFWDSVASNCILWWYSHFSTWTVFKFQYLQPIPAFCYSTLFVWGFLCAVGSCVVKLATGFQCYNSK